MGERYAGRSWKNAEYEKLFLRAFLWSWLGFYHEVGVTASTMKRYEVEMRKILSTMRGALDVS